LRRISWPGCIPALEAALKEHAGDAAVQEAAGGAIANIYKYAPTASFGGLLATALPGVKVIAMTKS